MLQRLVTRYRNVFVSSYCIGVSFMWNALHPIALPMLLLTFVSEETKNTIYGMITFVGLIIALLVQPICGALSDRTRHRLGRRRPWIVLGTGLDLVFLLIMVLGRNYWVVALGYVLLQISSNVAHGPAQGLLPDVVPLGKRGAAVGFKNLFDIVGIILAALVAGRLVDYDGGRLWLLFGVIALGLLLTVGATVLGVREKPTGEARVLATRMPPGGMRALFNVDFAEHREYARLLVSRFCVFFCSYAIQSFGLYYVRDVMGAESPAKLVGNLMMIIGAGVAIAAYPAGTLSERWGRKGLSLFACGLAIVGTGLFVLTRSMSSFWILGGTLGLGMGIFASVNWAWATDLIPAREAAKYLGLSNLATAGSAAISRLLGPVIDTVNGITPNAGYTAVFVLATISAIIGFFVTLGIHDPRAPIKTGSRRKRLRITPTRL